MPHIVHALAQSLRFMDEENTAKKLGKLLIISSGNPYPSYGAPLRPGKAIQYFSAMRRSSADRYGLSIQITVRCERSARARAA
jgi:hypothetical protein